MLSIRVSPRLRLFPIVLAEEEVRGLTSINSSLIESVDLEDEQTEIVKAVYHDLTCSSVLHFVIPTSLSDAN